MQKDPKRVLESLRIEEEDPLLHHRPRKFRKRKNELSQVSNSAILSLCLVTGLSSGVGSAFANSLEGNSQNNAPLDEPSSKVEQDKNVELPQMKAPQIKSSEVIPNNPPLDEPASEITKQPTNSENQHKHIEKGNSETSEQEQQTKETAETKQNKEQNEQKKEIKQESKHQKSQDSVKTEKSKQSDSSTNEQPQAKEKLVTPSVSTSEEKNTSQVPKKEKEETDTKVNKTEQSDILLPYTEEGGELPQTAGNDLNEAALGAGVALAGAFLLKRKRDNS